MWFFRPPLRSEYEQNVTIEREHAGKVYFLGDKASIESLSSSIWNVSKLHPTTNKKKTIYFFYMAAGVCPVAYTFQIYCQVVLFSFGLAKLCEHTLCVVACLWFCSRGLYIRIIDAYFWGKFHRGGCKYVYVRKIEKCEMRSETALFCFFNEMDLMRAFFFLYMFYKKSEKTTQLWFVWFERSITLGPKHSNKYSMRSASIYARGQVIWDGAVYHFLCVVLYV